MQPIDAFDAETWVSASKERIIDTSISTGSRSAVDADELAVQPVEAVLPVLFRSTRAANLAAGRDRNGTGLDDDQSATPILWVREIAAVASAFSSSMRSANSSSVSAAA